MDDDVLSGDLVEHIAHGLGELLAILRRASRPMKLDSRSELEGLADRLVELVKRLDVDGSPVARQLVTLHEELASHLLAALDLELAGVPAHTTSRLLEQARSRLADGLAGAVGALVLIDAALLRSRVRLPQSQPSA